MTPATPHAWITKLKKETGRTIPQLLALSRNNDPYAIGTPGQIKLAKWYAAAWKQEFDGVPDIHVKRVHYRLQAIPYPLPSGQPYENTPQRWAWIQPITGHARILGLVPVESFIDRRNPEPFPLNWRGDPADPPIPHPVDRRSYDDWRLPSLDFYSHSLDLLPPAVLGYEPDDYLDRAFHLELWIEKSTANDILKPLCKNLGIRFVQNIGFHSITSAIKLLKRIDAVGIKGKPTRIFYISDFDLAGSTMPVQVARQIEFWHSWKGYAPDADIKLISLALTPKQIEGDPNNPKKLWRKPLPINPQTHSVELDALEAIRPGQLEKIVLDAIAPYLDRTLDDQLADAEDQARANMRAQWHEAIEPYERRLIALRKSLEPITKKYQRQADRLRRQLAKDLAPFRKPLARLQSDVADQSSRFAPDLPARPKQIAGVIDESDWLYDSARDYLAQLAFYKKHPKPPKRKKRPSK